MMNIEMQIMHALKAAWIPRYIRDRAENTPWCLFPNMLFEQYGINDAILEMTFTNFDMLQHSKEIALFYKEIVTAFNMSKNISMPSTGDDILESVLWGNKYFTYKVKNKTFLLLDNHFLDINIINVKDLKIKQCKLDTMYLFNRLLNKTTFLSTVSKIMQCLKPYLKLINNHNPVGQTEWSQFH